jgi:hypothetical protein
MRVSLEDVRFFPAIRTLIPGGGKGLLGKTGIHLHLLSVVGILPCGGAVPAHLRGISLDTRILS